MTSFLRIATLQVLAHEALVALLYEPVEELSLLPWLVAFMASKVLCAVLACSVYVLWVRWAKKDKIISRISKWCEEA